jgi:colicin import membrane protein
MTRFETKCLVGAAGLHGLLLVVLVASSAFQSEPPKPQSFAPISWIAMKTTDTPGLMQGNPEARPVVAKAPAPAAKPAEPVAQPQPEKPQPKPAPEKVEERSEPAPTKVKTEAPKHRKHEVDADLTPIKSADSDPVNPKSWKPRYKKADDIKVDLGSKSIVKNTRPKHSSSSSSSSSDEEREARAEAAARRDAARAISQTLGGLANNITKGAAKAAVFDLPGQGGSAAFVDYRTALFSAYYNAWNCPTDIDNDLASVEVKVVVARNGSVISAEITKKSSDSTLNRSVQRALDAVSKLPPFPEGVNDDQRSFRLRFNLKAKQSLG